MIPYSREANKRHLPGSFLALVNTDMAPPVLGLSKDSVSAVTIWTKSNDPPIVFLDHTLEEKFEGRENVRAIDCRLHELLSHHRVCFCITLLPYDAVDHVKQWRVS